MTTPAPAVHAGMSSAVKALVVLVAAIGFLFDTYELLMFPVIGADAISELVFHKGFTALSEPERGVVAAWSGRMLWIAALAGGACGLVGGWLIDRLGRRTIMAASILLYSFSPVAAAYSSELWHLILFRCTTFIGVCVELVAAVTWLAELFHEKRSREIVIGWTLAMASLGGIFVTEVYNAIVDYLKTHPDGIAGFPVQPAAWRYTLLTGLVPGALILFLLPFVPESYAWKKRKLEGTLKRPSIGELFTPQLRRTTLVTAILSACGYAAAFGALQMTPLNIVPGLPDLAARAKEVAKADKEAVTPEQKKEVGAMRKALADDTKARRGDVQRWQEVGGLTGRILLAILLLFVPSRLLLRLFIVPGLVLLPATYLVFREYEYTVFAVAYFFCGLLTIAQFSYLSEFLPRVFPVHLRGTGGGFATNIGGRMVGTMAATLNTEVLSGLFGGGPVGVATAAAVIGGAVYAIAFVASFFLPNPPDEAA